MIFKGNEIKIKKTITLILIILLLNTNIAFAQNWVTITAENGKSADLDLDSIQLIIDTVEYNIKTEADNHIFINRFSTELYKSGTPTAVVERAEYIDNIEDNNKINEEKIESRSYKELKSGTLQAEIFDVLSKELEKRKFDKGNKTWEKYLNKQRKLIYKKWKPLDIWRNWDEYITPINFDDATIIVKKDGSVNMSTDLEIKELTKLEPLPKDYPAETFQLSVNTYYYKYAGKNIYTPKPLVKQISPTKAKINIAKNHRPPIIGHIEFGLLGLWKTVKILMSYDDFLIIPLIPVIAVLFCCVPILSLLLGVSWDDLRLE